MDAFFIFVAAAAGACALARILFSTRGVVRANRLRTQELKRGWESPESRSGLPDAVVESLQRADAAASSAAREDYALTGAFLAGLGVLAMFTGRAAAYGQWAVGLYTGGTVAIIVGIGLALFGAVLRILARPILDPSPPNRPTS